MKAKGVPLKTLCILTILGCVVSTLWAGPTTSYQAEKVVTGWLRTSTEPLGMVLGHEVKRVETFTNNYAEPIYYIVYLRPAGFAIVPADDLIEPIIGFLPEGLYNPSHDNPLGALVSRDLNGRIAAVRSTQGLKSTNVTAALLKAQDKWDRLTDLGDGGIFIKAGLATISDVRVAPLVQSNWDQRTCCVPAPVACYNYYTPPFPAGTPTNYPCGCVATAMAQVMRYHEYPTSGIGINFSTISVYGSPNDVNTRGGDGLGGAYNWDLMDYVPDCNTPGPNRAAIGALCYDAGVVVNMDYSAGSSAAYLATADANLVGIFGYSNCIYGWNSGANIGPGLTAMINPNLDYNHPVILGIMPEEGGHAIVCDGYGYNLGAPYHHLNMGWSGQQDAWYNFNDSNYMPPGYTYVDDCLYNLFKTNANELISGRVTNISGTPVAGVAVTAQRSGGGTYPATTDYRGIYVLAHVPSASTYTISPGPAYGTQVVNTGTSVDGTAVSGNVWGVDFTISKMYVDSNATGNDDGSSWEDAYNYLQDALAAASSGTQILVAEGTYRPDQKTGQTPGNRSATFQLINGVALYGGFPSGGCNDWADRHIATYETILSGDLTIKDIYVSDPCNLLTESTRAENSYHVVTGSNTDATAILDGFTITAGNADGSAWPDNEGGGMLNISSNCTVNKSKFVENSSSAGGGGMRNDYSNLHITNCIFFRNASGGSGGGGGVKNYNSSPTLLNCRFIWNEDVSGGSNAGGLFNISSSPAVTNCSFIKNSSVYGGAVSNVIGSCPEITNCTFTANLASSYSGAVNDWNDSYPIITNCIFWDNNAPAGSQIGDSGSSAATVNYSDVQGGWTGAGGVGNINIDPCFMDANGPDDVIGTLDDNITLSVDSPCIDVGDNTAVPSGVTTDLDGRLRIADGDCNDSDIVDMGASEFAYVYIGDLDCDCAVDFFDFAIFARHWLVSAH